MAILAYILGVISGLLLAIVAAHFAKTKPEVVDGIIERGYPKLTDFRRESVEFLDPGSDAGDAVREVIEEHDLAGEYTPLEEIS